MKKVKDQRVKCAVCGLIYPKDGPYPPCRADDGPMGPKGFRAAELRFMKCVLGQAPPKDGQ